MPIEDLRMAADARAVEGPEGYQFEGSECLSCGEKYFPPRQVCFSCSGTQMRPYLLPSHGTLYSYSRVHVSLQRETPYDVGYIDLDDGVRVFSVLASDGTPWAVDMRVRLTKVRESWAFCPADEEEVRK
ncbi:Zn-ribbon domain-containing OB-fold protein [Parafrigoribacterium humi]|uniref:Zn-ribbon domain-containing OB-fold protein n=1 Tax=Parafrigoribacterium humi TaxID=3144664 RepID=UPI0032EDAAD8